MGTARLRFPQRALDCRTRKVSHGLAVKYLWHWIASALKVSAIIGWSPCCCAVPRSVVARFAATLATWCTPACLDQDVAGGVVSIHYTNLQRQMLVRFISITSNKACLPSGPFKLGGYTSRGRIGHAADH
mmetsp:Transcript_126926/g.317183  ORF Transcript_126926/g.317183 Transcript_126926/m.317183 type:complete len:130 (-) Transcript_126926:709-1098(-)